jgi:hypothetical protein
MYRKYPLNIINLKKYTFRGPVGKLRRTEPVFLSSPGIDSKESIPPAYVA